MLCVEMEEDKHLDGRHAIEEAMSAYLSYPVQTPTDPVFQQLVHSCVIVPSVKKVRGLPSLSPPSLHLSTFFVEAFIKEMGVRFCIYVPFRGRGRLTW